MSDDTDDRGQLLFTLFRAQIHLPGQLSLLSNLRTEPEILKAAILEKPTLQHSRGAWHIGNVKQLPLDGLYFAIGKELPKQVAFLDDEGDFHNQSAIFAPNTHVLLDLKYQVLGIAKNSDLSPEPKAVARKLRDLLRATEVVEQTGCKVSIAVIYDPAEFVDMIKEASAVTKFQVSYGLPNVWDAEEDFQKPMQETSKALGSDSATASFSADDLNRDKLVSLTRAATAIGKKAKAWLRRPASSKKIQVTTDKNPAIQSAAQLDESQLVRWASVNRPSFPRHWEPQKF
jgi:hypothetical protein